MQRTDHVSVKGPDSIRRVLLKQLRSVVDKSPSKDYLLSVISDTQIMIESLPLASGEYGAVSNRLRNARRYLRSDEQGAATYELRLLMGDLREVTAAKRNSDQREAEFPEKSGGTPHGPAER